MSLLIHCLLSGPGYKRSCSHNIWFPLVQTSTATLLTPFLSSLSQNVTVGNTPWPVQQHRAEGHASQEAAKSLRDTPGKRQVPRSTSMRLAAAPNKGSLCPLWLLAWLSQNQQGSIPAALGNRMGQERIGWAAPTFCAPLTCTERGLHVEGTWALKKGTILKTFRHWIGDVEAIFCRQLIYTKHSRVLPPNQFQVRDLMVTASRVKALL